jgi:hypothetical protein
MGNTALGTLSVSGFSRVPRPPENKTPVSANVSSRSSRVDDGDRLEL